MGYTTLGILLTGILIRAFWGWNPVARIFKKSNLEIEDVPERIPERLWKALSTGSQKPGRVIGILEMFIGAIAAWTASYELVGGWLVFKVASKWESWSNIVKIPEKISVQAEGFDDVEYLRCRRLWSDKIMTRFLIGTGVSILSGILAGYVGMFVVKVLPHLGSVLFHV